jgi:hypothetical protein
MIDIAIQIVNYNTKKYLVNCLAGVISDLNDSSISYKILVADNASQDDLRDLEEKYRDVAFYYSQKNTGFGVGHNFLAKKAESKYILILNPDLKFLEPRTVERLFSYIEKGIKDRIAVVGPKLLNTKGVQIWDHGVQDGAFAWFVNKIGGSHWRNDKEGKNVAWVSGGVFMILREVFNQISGFDENFFLYKEEEDLCLRLRNKGYKIMYLPDIKVFHYGSVVASKDKFFDVSNKYFLEKHFGGKGLITYLVISIFNKLKHKFLNKIIYPK